MTLPGCRSAGGRAILGLLALLMAGCMTQDKVVPAINEVNQVFRNQYESILAQKGTRVFALPRERTFAGVRAALSQLGMRMDGQDADLGYLNFSAPAPLPLNMQEWGEVAKADLPMMREIAARHVGLIPSWFLSFEPEGLEIVINATVIPAAGASEVSLTARMRQVTPPPSGIPRREYAPPTGVHKAIDKIWAQIERELGVRGRSP
jgi:hypothetical protein